MSEAKYDASADSPSCSGMSWSSSNVCAGFVVQVFGYQIGFVTLAAIAVGGLVFLPCSCPKQARRKALALRCHKAILRAEVLWRMPKPMILLVLTAQPVNGSICERLALSQLTLREVT